MENLSLAGTDEDAGLTGDLDVLDDLELVGVGAASSILDGGGIDRLLHVHGGTLLAEGLGLRGGFGFGNYFYGGGVLLEGAAGAIQSSKVFGNEANFGGGVAMVGGTLLVEGRRQ